MSRWLRLALLAYPSRARRRDGDVLLGLAADLIDGGGSDVRREAVGLARGGLARRLRPLRQPGWHRALRRAATVALVVYAGLVGALTATAIPAWGGWPGFAWAALVAATVTAVVALGTRRWGLLSVAVAALVLIGVATSNRQMTALAGWFDADVSVPGLEFGYVLPMLGWAIPPLLLCLLAAASADPEGPRGRPGTLVAWVLVVGVAAWTLPAAGAAVGLPVGRFAAAGLVGAVALVAVLVAGLVLGRRDRTWWPTLTLLLASVAPFPLIVLADSGAGAGLALLLAVALVGTLVAGARRVRLA